MATLSDVWVCCRLLAGIVGSNPTGVMHVICVSVVSCQVKVSAMGWSLVHWIATECGVSKAEITRDYLTCCLLASIRV